MSAAVVGDLGAVDAEQIEICQHLSLWRRRICRALRLAAASAGWLAAGALSWRDPGGRTLPDMLALLQGAGGSALLGGSLGRAPVRHGALRMQELPTGGSDLEANNEQGNTFWATLDGRDEDGISSDGMVPPGDDLIEEDLKRVFSIDPEEEGLAGDSGFSDMDEVQVLPPSPRIGMSPLLRPGVPVAPPRYAKHSPASPSRLATHPRTHSPARPPARPPAHSFPPRGCGV